MYNNYSEDSERRMSSMLGNYYCIAHVIRPGDTLYKLSREYGVKVSALMMANPFVDVYNLRVGDELCIPRLRRPDNMAGNERVVDAEMRMRIPSAEEERMEDERNNRNLENTGNAMNDMNRNVRREMSDMTRDDRETPSGMNTNTQSGMPTQRTTTDTVSGTDRTTERNMSDTDRTTERNMSDTDRNTQNNMVDINRNAETGTDHMRDRNNNNSCALDMCDRMRSNTIQMPQENWRMYTRESLTRDWIEEN